MIGKWYLLALLSATSLYAALGSGPFLKSGIGLNGLAGTKLYMISSEQHYREVASDSLMIHYKDFAENDAMVTPVIFAGWEQSFNLVFSMSSGVALTFTGAQWEGMKTHNLNTGSVTKSPIDAVLNLVYLTVPVEAKLMLPINSGGFTLALGPRFSLLTSAVFENAAQKYDSNEYDTFNPVMMGIGGSIGGEVQLRKLDLLIALHIEGGTASIMQNDQPDVSYVQMSLETGLRLSTRRCVKAAWWPL